MGFLFQKSSAIICKSNGPNDAQPIALSNNLWPDESKANWRSQFNKIPTALWLSTSGSLGLKQIRSVSDRINPQNHTRTSDRGPHNRVECARAPFCADHRSDTEAANLISKQVRWLSFSFSQSADLANIQSRALHVPVWKCSCVGAKRSDRPMRCLIIHCQKRIINRFYFLKYININNINKIYRKFLMLRHVL